MTYFLGLDGGSVSVKLCALDCAGTLVFRASRRHQGRPVEAASELLTEASGRLPEGARLMAVAVGSTGKLLAAALGLPMVNELAAAARGAARLFPQARSVIEMGGEDAKLILLDNDESGSVRDFALNSACAAGTGSFLDQQAERLKLSIEEFAELATAATATPAVAGRCSVFAKSDMIHLQQVGTPVADISAGLCAAVARNFKGAIARGRTIAPPVVLAGGVANNPGVVKAFAAVLAPEVSPEDILVPEAPETLCALGAALLALDGQLGATLPDDSPARLARLACHGEQAGAGPAAQGRHESLSQADEGRPARHRWGDKGLSPGRAELPKAANGTATEAAPLPVWLGVDIGSISTNLVLLDAGGRLIAKRYLRTAGRPIEAVRQGLEELAAEFGDSVEVRAVGTTGSGRYMLADLLGADVVKNEITAQARAAAFIDPEVEAVFEIGGQDSKFIALKDGIIVDFEMNKACAAGTGSFLEEQAEKLGVCVKTEFSDMALASSGPCRLGERCTVFMENSLMTGFTRGAAKPDLLAGLAYSIVENYLNRVVAGRPVGGKVFFQGGTAFNKSVAAAFEKRLGRPVVVPEHHDVTGAIGMALIALDALPPGSDKKTAFPGLGKVSMAHEAKSFECKACDNRCAINQVTLKGEGGTPGKKLFYGGRCEKYDVRRQAPVDVPDLFAFREAELTRAHEGYAAASAGRSSRGKVALPRAFFMHDLLPFFSTLLWELGFAVELSPPTSGKIAKAGSELALSDACFPIKAALGHVQESGEKTTGPIFIPAIVNLNPPDAAVADGMPCPLVQSFADQARAALPELKGRIVSPVVDFSRSDSELVDELRRGFAVYGVRLAGSEVRAAIAKGRASQTAFTAALQARGREVLDSLTERSLAILGRPYSAFDSGMNLDVPAKLARLGVLAIPMDMLPGAGDFGPLAADFPEMYWRSGQRLLAAARYVREHPLLYPLVIGNFSCGPDSFILKFLARELGEKPWLHVEIDEHSADAGVITRCEAFLDSVDRRAESRGHVSFDRGRLRAPKSGAFNLGGRRIFLPPMCDHTHALAAAFRASGVAAEVLPDSGPDSVALAAKYVSGKECYPFALTTGDMLKKALSPDFEPEKSAFFMPGGRGPCRFGQYNLAQRVILDDLGMARTPIFSPVQDERLWREAGMAIDGRFARRSWEGLIAVDLLLKILRRARPYEKTPGAANELYATWLDRFCRIVERPEKSVTAPLATALGQAAEDFRGIMKPDADPRPVIGVVGEIYVRSNRYANESLIRRIEALGGEARLAPVDEWVGYVNHLSLTDLRRNRKWKNWLGMKLRSTVQRSIVRRMEAPLHGFIPHEPAIREILDAAGPILADSLRGEAVLSVGKSRLMMSGENGEAVDGVISAMPFGCMPGNLVAGFLRSLSEETGTPTASQAFDGVPSPAAELHLETFMAQARRRFQQRLNGGRNSRARL